MKHWQEVTGSGYVNFLGENWRTPISLVSNIWIRRNNRSGCVVDSLTHHAFWTNAASFLSANTRIWNLSSWSIWFFDRVSQRHSHRSEWWQMRSLICWRWLFSSTESFPLLHRRDLIVQITNQKWCLQDVRKPAHSRIFIGFRLPIWRSNLNRIAGTIKRAKEDISSNLFGLKGSGNG